MAEPVDASRDRIEYDLFSRLIKLPEDEAREVIQAAEELRRHLEARRGSLGTRWRGLFNTEARRLNTKVIAARESDAAEQDILAVDFAECDLALLDSVVSMASHYWESRREVVEVSDECPAGEPLFCLGTYQVYEELGGGMGTVYKTWQHPPGRLAALKVIEKQRYTPAAQLRFRSEARKAGRLDHPGLVAVLEVGEIEDRLYYSMPFVQGKDLSQCLAERGPLSPTDAAELIRSVAYAVQYAHRQGIVHCDLKPENILLDPHGQGSQELGAPRVTDFGVARSQDLPPPDEAQGGTLPYMAPEQHNPSLRPDERADIFALGVILCELVQGEVPFTASTARELLEQKQRGPEELACLHATATPLDFAAIVKTCLQPNKLSRYENAGALADELDRFLNGRPVDARPVRLLERLSKWAYRQPWAATTVAVIAIFLIVGAVGSLVAASIYRSERDRADQNAQTAKQKAAEAEENAEKFRKERDRVVESSLYAQRQIELSLEILGQLDQGQISLLNLDYLFGLEEDLESRLREWELKIRDESIEDYPTTHAAFANALYNLARIKAALRSPKESLPTYQKAAAAYETLVARYPENSGYDKNLVDLLNSLATEYAELGEFDRSDNALCRARDLTAEHADERMDDVDYVRNLATTYLNLGAMYHRQGNRLSAKASLDKARSLYERVIEISPDGFITLETFRNLGGVENNLAAIYRSEGDLAKAIAIMEANLARQEQFLEEGTQVHDQELMALLGSSYNGLGMLYLVTDEIDKGMELCEKGRQILEQLDPKEIRYRRYLARCYRNLGMGYRESRQPDQAEDVLQNAIGIFEDLGSEELGLTDLDADIGAVYTQLAMIKLAQREYDKALSLIDQGLPYVAKNYDKMPDVPEWRSSFFTVHFVRAPVMLRTGHYAEALESANHALSLSGGDEAKEYLLGTMRAVALAGTDKYKEAIDEALRVQADVPDSMNSSAGELDLARVYALASASVPRDPDLTRAESRGLSATHALIAVEILTRAKQNGRFRDEDVAKDVQDDPAFDSLRERPEFVALWTDYPEEPPESSGEKPYFLERLGGDWRRVTSVEAGISFEMPGEPNRQTRKQTLPAGPVHRIMYQLKRNDDASTLSVHSASLPPGEPTPTGDEPFDQVRLMCRMQGQLLEETEVKLDNHVGREFVVKMPLGVYQHLRFFVVDRKMYQLMVTGRQREMEPDDERFLNSVRLLKGGEQPDQPDNRDAVAAELKRLQGVWKLVRAELEGVDIMDRQSYDETRVEGNFTLTELDGEIRRARFEIDPTQAPKEITVTSFGKPIRGIYELEGDTWKQLISRSGFPRPKSLDDKGMYFEYKRVTNGNGHKPEDEHGLEDEDSDHEEPAVDSDPN